MDRQIKKIDRQVNISKQIKKQIKINFTDTPGQTDRKINLKGVFAKNQRRIGSRQKIIAFDR